MGSLVLSINPIHDHPTLLYAIRNGARPKYLFFWGHKPARPGSMVCAGVEAILLLQFIEIRDMMLDSVRIVVVVFTELDENTIRIISMRKALSHEQKRYEQAYRNEFGTL